MTIAEFIELARVFGIPGTILFSAFILRNGTISAGTDVGAHVDDLKKEMAALKATLAHIDEKRSRGEERLHKELDGIRQAISDLRVHWEGRVARLETKVNGQSKAG